MTTTRPFYSASAGNGDSRYAYDVDEGFAPSGAYVILDRQTGDVWFGARLTRAGLTRVRREVDRLNRTAG